MEAPGITDQAMSKPVVFMTHDKIPEIACKLLQERFTVICWPEQGLTNAQLRENVKGVFGIFCIPRDRINREVLDAAGTSLKVVSTFSVGYDHVDRQELKSRGIKLGYTPDVLTEATAEMGVALLLSVARRVTESNRLVLRKEWTKTSWTPQWLLGHGLENSTVGIIGAGRIGSSVARKLLGFSINRLMYSSRKEKPELTALGAENQPINKIMSESDFIIVTVAATEETKGIINRTRINSMKPNAIFVNISRGVVVDQKALTEALEQKKIAGAGLDVLDPEPIEPDDPLLKLDNVVITPHLASATYGARNAMSVLAANNIIAVLDGKKMPAEVTL